MTTLTPCTNMRLFGGVSFAYLPPCGRHNPGGSGMGPNYRCLTRAAPGVVAWVVASTVAIRSAAGQDLAVLKKGCEGGEAADCRRLGLAHREGHGVRKDMAYAAASFRKACDGGDAAGCTSLADLHLRGMGVPRDEARAASLSERACEGGDPFGCIAPATPRRAPRSEQDTEGGRACPRTPAAPLPSTGRPATAASARRAGGSRRPPSVRPSNR